MIQKNRKIKIVYILPSLDQGGAERFLVDLLINIDKTKFNPSLILFQRGGPWLEDLKIKNIPVIILHKKYKFDPYNFWQILKTLQKIKPQIVHTQLGGDIYGKLAAKFLRLPIILSTEQNVNRNEKIIIKLLKIITNFGSQKIIAISQAVKNDLINRYQLNSKKIIIIPNGVELKKFLKNEEKHEEKKELVKNNSKKIITFGSIGRLSPQKGYSVLIQAWSQLKNKNIKCSIHGNGPLLLNLKKEIKKFNLEDSIELLGNIKNPAIFLKKIDAFILPSLWEGQGIVLLEAGLSGLPIIASEVDGVKELITKETGYLVPPSDSQALAQKIDWLATNLNTRTVKNNSKKLKKIIMENYDIKKITLKYEKLYHELFQSYLNSK